MRSGHLSNFQALRRTKAGQGQWARIRISPRITDGNTGVPLTKGLIGSEEAETALMALCNLRID